MTNVLGRSSVPMPFPATSLIYGFSVCCQAGVFDIHGSEAFYPGLALSHGLKLRIGQYLRATTDPRRPSLFGAAAS